MGVEIRKILVAAHMVPVNVGSHSGDWFTGQAQDLVLDIADSKAGINQ